MSATERLGLRAATLADAEWLLRWRNDSETVAALEAPHVVTPEEHATWLLRRVRRPHFYIAEVAGRPIGTGRLDPRFELAITMAPEVRGQGLATPLIEAISARTAHPVWARIRPDNVRSQRAFERAGFRRSPLWLYVPSR